MELTRQEKEKLVLDLRSQGKTFREIAKEAQISPRDIKDILNKSVSEEQSMSISSQAYRLFSKGKTTLEVAIALQLEADKVSEYHNEYLKLIHLDNLNQIYEEIGDNDIEPFVRLYKSAKAAGMGIQHVNRLLNIANNNDLPELENRYQELKKELAILEFQKHNSVIILQELSNQITHLHSTSESYRSSLQEEALELNRLRIQKKKLEAIIEEIQNNDRYYLRIKHTAQQQVEGILRNSRELLKLALVSITESIRNNPSKFNFLFDGMSSSPSSITLPIDYSGSSQNYSPYPYTYKQYPSQDNYTKVYTDTLLDEAEKLYSKMVKDFTNKTISDPAILGESSSMLSLWLA
jgi:DNA-binding CsgD family transcriptional regulator